MALLDLGLLGLPLRSGDVQGDESVRFYDATASFTQICEDPDKVRPTLTDADGGYMPDIFDKPMEERAICPARYDASLPQVRCLAERARA